MPGELPRHVVLDELEIDDGSVRLVAWRDSEDILWIGISGPRPFTGAIGCHTGSSDDAVEFTSCSSPTAAVVWGYVDSVVARCEIRSQNGEVLPARIVPVPPVLSSVDRAVWGAVPEATHGTWAPSIVGYGVDGTVLGHASFATGPIDTVATGEHPDLGPWSVKVVPLNSGLILEVNLEREGGGGSSLHALEGQDLGGLMQGWGGESNHIAGMASTRVERVSHVLDDGRTIEAVLFDLPQLYVGPARYHVAFVSGERRIAGVTTAYDRNGDVVARQEFGRDPPPRQGGDGGWSFAE